MARRGKKAAASAPTMPYNTIGVTVLPGVPLPDWVAPAEPEPPMAAADGSEVGLDPATLAAAYALMDQCAPGAPGDPQAAAGELDQNPDGPGGQATPEGQVPPEAEDFPYPYGYQPGWTPPGPAAPADPGTAGPHWAPPSRTGYIPVQSAPPQRVPDLAGASGGGVSPASDAFAAGLYGPDAQLAQPVGGGLVGWTAGVDPALAGGAVALATAESAGPGLWHPVADPAFDPPPLAAPGPPMDLDAAAVPQGLEEPSQPLAGWDAEPNAAAEARMGSHAGHQGFPQPMAIPQLPQQSAGSWPIDDAQSPYAEAGLGQWYDTDASYAAAEAGNRLADAAAPSAWAPQYQPTPGDLFAATGEVEQLPGEPGAAFSPPDTPGDVVDGGAGVAGPPEGPVQGDTAPAPEGPAARTKRGRGRSLLVGLLVVVSGALLGYAAFAGVNHFLSSGAAAGSASEPVALPATINSYVQVTGPTADAALGAMFGSGAQASGASTAAYSSTPGGQVEAGALATASPQPPAPAQFKQFAKRTGAQLGEPVAGSGAQSGISCAAASKSDNLAAGSLCVWDIGSARGQTYVLGAEPQAAIRATAQLVMAMSAVPAT